MTGGSLVSGADMTLQKNALITVFGGTGFLGRHIVNRLAKAGYRLRIATRRPNEALFLKTSGTPGQLEIVQANIRDAASTQAALSGADGVVNAVGILFESGKQKFSALQAEGATRIGEAAKAEGISAMVHIPPLAPMPPRPRFTRNQKRRAKPVFAPQCRARIFCGLPLLSGRRMIFSIALPPWR